MKRKIEIPFFSIKSSPLIIYGLLGIVVWIAHFLFFQSFGLYEDDWAFTGNAMNNSLSQNIEGVMIR
ncbi:MAG: hypothetical protein IM477_07160 [Microcystis sp. M090S1]|jgi:hypothetical protein|uniref:hypothetical protein n=1 Tax=Microcystis sp. M090S1 TaxID=2771135 RepID=UPI00258E0B97|nr:hypothetical protein [Microcystis sp. M090S1]MCA2812331.1 hypothetical protein [Microcystis sp. M090S1]